MCCEWGGGKCEGQTHRSNTQHAAQARLLATQPTPPNPIYLQNQQMTDRTSMPSIWIGGSFVGGCRDGPGVMPLHEQGKLVPLLQQAGAMR